MLKNVARRTLHNAHRTTHTTRRRTKTNCLGAPEWLAIGIILLNLWKNYLKHNFEVMLSLPFFEKKKCYRIWKKHVHFIFSQNTIILYSKSYETGNFNVTKDQINCNLKKRKNNRFMCRISHQSNRYEKISLTES